VNLSAGRNLKRPDGVALDHESACAQKRRHIHSGTRRVVYRRTDGRNVAADDESWRQ
jgi:hypothetical protein